MRFCFEQKDFIEHNIRPDQLAVIDNQRELTWIQFEAEVDRICLFFKQNQWDRLAKPVILYGHKQSMMIAAVYAMMKLKIPYIPLDIIYPKQRIVSIQNLAGAEVIMNFTDCPLNIDTTTEVLMKNDKLQIINHNSVSLTERNLDADYLVYIIFTSGSTGIPKGVQITSRAVQTFTKWMSNDFGFSSKDIFINIAILSFDLSVYELMSFGALGAALLLNDKHTTDDPELFMSRIEKYQSTIWVSTPSFALNYSRIGADTRLNSLKYFLFCGETLPHKTAANLHQAFPSAVIYNTYGPTEATVATTKIEITQDILDKYNPLPIGFPKPECKIIIEKIDPEDKEGELIIIGDHVSIGYLNNEELNTQKFFFDGAKRAFRTGDIAFYEDGMLFCKGRNDEQVKMHGYRIELNEITSALCTNKMVSDAVTVGLRRNNEVKKIVSFVILKKDIPANELNEALKSFLKKILPYYMVPGDVVPVKDFPYSNSHKIDKNRLIEDYLNRQFNGV